MKDNLKTPEIIKRLANKFPSPSYGFITQVRNGTGLNGNRTADAMAMSLWPSRGLHVYGFEVKANRTDWIKELNSPQKADAIASYCHYWYLVIGAEDIVKGDELPKTWGLIVPDKDGLKIKKEAEFNKEALPFDYTMLAGIFRNIADYCVPKEIVENQIQESVAHRTEGWRKSRDDAEKETQKIKDILHDFELKTGLRIYEWDKESNIELIKSVKMALEGNNKIAEVKHQLDKLKGVGERIGKYIDDEIERYQI